MFIYIVKKGGVTLEEFRDFQKVLDLFEIAGVINASICTKIAVHFGLFCKSIEKLGTEKHIPLLEKALKLHEMGCFMMTEIGHGSNV